MPVAWPQYMHVYPVLDGRVVGVVSRGALAEMQDDPACRARRLGDLVGLVSLEDLLKARAHNLEAERRRERVHPMHLLFPPRSAREEEQARAAS